MFPATDYVINLNNAPNRVNLESVITSFLQSYKVLLNKEGETLRFTPRFDDRQNYYLYVDPANEGGRIRKVSMKPKGQEQAVCIDLTAQYALLRHEDMPFHISYEHFKGLQEIVSESLQASQNTTQKS